MLRTRGSYLWLGCFALVGLTGELAQGGATNRLDRAWKIYHNIQQGYCVSYPSRWARGDAFEGAGLFVKTGVRKAAKASGEIDVAAEPTLPEPGTQTASLTLVDDLKLHMDGLAKFERAERMEVLEQHPLKLAGDPALFTKDRYYDPLERATWIEELVFSHHDNRVYRLELECRADELTRFEPVFNHFINTFQFECSEAQ